MAIKIPNTFLMSTFLLKTVKPSIKIKTVFKWPKTFKIFIAKIGFELNHSEICYVKLILPGKLMVKFYPKQDSL